MLHTQSGRASYQYFRGGEYTNVEESVEATRCYFGSTGEEKQKVFNEVLITKIKERFAKGELGFLAYKLDKDQRAVRPSSYDEDPSLFAFNLDACGQEGEVESYLMKNEGQVLVILFQNADSLLKCAFECSNCNSKPDVNSGRLDCIICDVQLCVKCSELFPYHMYNVGPDNRRLNHGDAHRRFTIGYQDKLVEKMLVLPASVEGEEKIIESALHRLDGYPVTLLRSGVQFSDRIIIEIKKMDFPQRYIEAQEVIRKEKVLEAERQNKIWMENRKAKADEEKRKQAEPKDARVQESSVSQPALQQQPTSASDGDNSTCSLC